MAWGSIPDYFSADFGNVVDLWYDEVEYYDFDDPGTSTDPSKAIGHFTQVVWKGSTKLGCGVASCPSGQVVVCQYSAAGNYLGQYGDNVGRGTRSASDCSGSTPDGTPPATTPEPGGAGNDLITAAPTTVLPTTSIPAPTLKASTTLVGMTLVQFDAAAESIFKQAVVSVLPGKKESDVAITGKTEVVRRRMLLAAGVQIDYEIAGFTSQDEVQSAVQSVQDGQDAVLSKLKEDARFADVTGIVTDVPVTTTAATTPAGQNEDSDESGFPGRAIAGVVIGVLGMLSPRQVLSACDLP